VSSDMVLGDLRSEFLSVVLFVFWYYSPNVLDTPRVISYSNKLRCIVAPKCLNTDK
jgi:hypothetical protein